MQCQEGVHRWLRRALRLMLSTNLPRNMSRIMLFASLNLASLSNCSPAKTKHGCAQHVPSPSDSLSLNNNPRRETHIKPLRTLFPACTDTAALPNDRMLLYLSTPTSTWIRVKPR